MMVTDNERCRVVCGEVAEADGQTEDTELA